MPSAARPKQAVKSAARRPAQGRSVASTADRPEASVQYEQRATLHDQICDLITGGMSARAACVEVGVPMSRWMTWLHRGSVDADQYARAMQGRAHALADEIVEVADTTDDPQRARVRVDARKWTAARMDPKRWGDRLDVTSNGEKLAGGVVILPAVIVPTAHGPMAAVQPAEVVARPSSTLQALQSELPPTTGLLR